MRIITDGLVIRHADYGDYDRMLTIITPGHGRIEAVARGCRRLKSPLVNASELFTSGEFTLYEGKGRVSVEMCQISESFYPLRSDYDRLTHGVYWLRLLDALVLPDMPSQQVFMLALRALAYLAYSELPAPLVTFAFESHLMALEGMSPRVDSCVKCGRPLDDDARFDIIRGGAVCTGCEFTAPRISYGARRILYRLPATKFAAFEKLKDHPDWPEAAKLMRGYIIKRINIPEKFCPPLN